MYTQTLNLNDGSMSYYSEYSSTRVQYSSTRMHTFYGCILRLYRITRLRDGTFLILSVQCDGDITLSYALYTVIIFKSLQEEVLQRTCIYKSGFNGGLCLNLNI